MIQNNSPELQRSDRSRSEDEFADLGSTAMVKKFLDFLSDEIEADPAKLVPHPGNTPRKCLMKIWL
jgi:hypothetical protein